MGMWEYIFDATLEDVVGFLMSKDARGKTAVDLGTKFALPKVYKIYLAALDALAILLLERYGPLF